ncbi:GDYXXLXY domain-containing protein [Halomonas sp. LC1]|uniref:GDYXXLXY domain-containing protein n=1 Tax=Halomonas sp. LC1 TaxID=3043733 RepID=UPI00255414E8|nr:GDYXXLXY domain-containing protein [Halomonas sp. LC1]MDK9686336.1 GDYXXLXY domain-containing protein [Halomonas sp. LC1]
MAASVRRFRWVVLLTTLAMLVVVNSAIWQKERHIAQGEVVYLELAPVDPRSLMQGDYMALNFALANRLQSELYQRGETPSASMNGDVVVRVDSARVAYFQRIDDGTPLEADERRLQFRLRHGRVRFATNAFFFQEGHAERYETAHYGEFRVNKEGELLLTALYDDTFQRLGED